MMARSTKRSNQRPDTLIQDRMPARLLGDHALKPHSMQVERLDERIDHMDRVVLAYPILQTFRQERQLGSVRAFNEASHPYPPSGNGGILADSWLFTQPGSKPEKLQLSICF